MKNVFVGNTVDGDGIMFPVIRPGFFKFFKKFSPGRACPPVEISVTLKLICLSRKRKIKEVKKVPVSSTAKRSFRLLRRDGCQ